MNDEKRDEPEAEADVEIEDLDVEEPGGFLDVKRNPPPKP